MRIPNLVSRLSMAVACLLVCASPAFAAGGGGGPLDVNWASFGYTLGAFIAALLLLAKFAWGPLLKALDEREGRIKESLEAAERALEESAERQKEHEAVMAEARREATSIVDEGKRDAQAVKEGIVNDAKKESDELLRRARAEIEQSKVAAIDDLHKYAVDLSMLLAERVTGKSLTPSDHQKLIQETIDQYGQS